MFGVCVMAVLLIPSKLITFLFKGFLPFSLTLTRSVCLSVCLSVGLSVSLFIRMCLLVCWCYSLFFVSHSSFLIPHSPYPVLHSPSSVSQFREPHSRGAAGADSAAVCHPHAAGARQLPSGAQDPGPALGQPGCQPLVSCGSPFSKHPWRVKSLTIRRLAGSVDNLSIKPCLLRLGWLLLYAHIHVAATDSWVLVLM